MIPAGATRATIPVTVAGSSSNPPDKTFQMLLLGGGGAARSFTPSFATQQTFAAGTYPYSVTAADLNGDGKLDLIVANDGGNTVSVLLNTTAPGATTPSFATHLSATKLLFGNVYQTAAKTLSITVTNKATTGSITLTGATVGGANAGDFAVTGGSCGGSLAALSSCTYAITFTPSTETAESGTLSIGVAEDPNGGPPAVGLIGTGVTPLKVLPASLAFGTIAGGHSSTNKTVTVYNYGGAAVSLSESIGGTNPGDFAVTGGTCSGTLAGGGAHCTYLLKFTPSIVGAESATLGVSAVGDGASPHNVSLGGTGS